MALDERSRHELFLRLEEALGPEAATTLMEHLPPVGWADVSMKRDVTALEVAMRRDLDALEQRLDLRIDALEQRLGLRAGQVGGGEKVIDHTMSLRFLMTR